MSFATTVKRGLLTGLTMSFVGAIGMVETFNSKVLISPILTMGYAVLFGLPFAIVWVSTKRVALEGFETEPPNIRDVLNGAVIGLVGGISTSLYLLLVNSTDLTDTFPNMGPAMVKEMTFDKDLGVGLALLTLGAVVAGAAGGALRLIPDRARRAVAYGATWVLGLAFLELVVTDIFSFVPALTDFIYALNGGLNTYAALIIFVVVAVLAYTFVGERASCENGWSEQIRRVGPDRRCSPSS